MDIQTANIFTRPMSRLRRVKMWGDELKNGILTQTIGDFVDPRLQYRYANEIAAIRWLCPTLEAKQRNEDAVANLKKMLPAGTMSAVVQGGMGEENVTEKNGVICIDIDAKDNPAITDWQAFKYEVAKSRFIAYVGLSVSGLGVFALIPLADPELHMQHYAAIEQDFKRATFTFMQAGDSEPTTLIGVNLDPSCKDIARKRFVSYDPQPYYNTEAVIYCKTYEPPKPQPTYQRPYSGQHTWSLQGWLDAHGIAYNARERQGGIQYIVTCPWQHLHSSKSKAESTLFEYPDGRPGFKCMHGHCADKDWHAYREFYEPRAGRTNFIPTSRELSPEQIAGFKALMQQASERTKPALPPTAEEIAPIQAAEDSPVISGRESGTIKTIGDWLDYANETKLNPRRVSASVRADGKISITVN